VPLGTPLLTIIAWGPLAELVTVEAIWSFAKADVLTNPNISTKGIAARMRSFIFLQPSLSLQILLGDTPISWEL